MLPWCHHDVIRLDFAKIAAVCLFRWLTAAAAVRLRFILAEYYYIQSEI